MNKEKEEFNKHYSDIAKQSGISFVGQIFNNVMNFFIGIVLARFFGPIILGQFRLGTTLVNVISNFTKVGMDRGLIKYIPKYITKNNKGKLKDVILFTFIISLTISIIIGIILYISAPFIAKKIFNDLEMVKVIRISSVYLSIFTLFKLSDALLKGFKRIDLLTYILNFIVPILYLISILIAYKIDINLFGVYFSRILSHLIGIIIIIYVFKNKLFSEFKKVNIDEIKRKEYIYFSLPLLFVGLLYFLISNIDILMLGYFSTSEQVGIYTVAVKIAILVTFILTSVNSIFSPIMSELIEKNNINILKNLYKNLTKWILFFGLNFLTFILIFSNEIMNIFGKEYVVGNIALIILTLGQVFNIAVGSTGMLLIMGGYQKYEFYNSLGICILNIILNIILIPKMGIEGAAIATATSIILINILKIIEVYHVYKFHPYNKYFYKPFLSFILIIIIFLFIQSKLNIYYLYKLLIAGLINIILNFLILKFIPFEEVDQVIFNKIINKIKK